MPECCRESCEAIGDEFMDTCNEDNRSFVTSMGVDTIEQVNAQLDPYDDDTSTHPIHRVCLLRLLL